jgi:hypothetical protein
MSRRTVNQFYDRSTSSTAGGETHVAGSSISARALTPVPRCVARFLGPFRRVNVRRRRFSPPRALRKIATPAPSI